MNNLPGLGHQTPQYNFTFDFDFPQLDPNLNIQIPPPLSPRFVIKVPPMAAGPALRRSGRHRTASESAGPSGSEYHESEHSMEMNPKEEVEEDQGPHIQYATSKRGRKVVKKTYNEITSEDDGNEDFGDEDDRKAPDLFGAGEEVVEVKPIINRRILQENDDDDDEDEHGVMRRPARRTKKHLPDFIVSDEEDKPSGRYPVRSRTKKPPPRTSASNGTSRRSAQQANGVSQRTRRLTRRNAARASHEEEDNYVDQTSSGASADADGSFDDAPHTSSDLEMEIEPEPEPEPEEEGDGKPYALRQRQRINYAIPPPLEEMTKPPARNGGGRNGAGRNGGGGGWGGGGHGGGRAGGRSKGPGWSATGAELGKWMGMNADDSDSDHPTRTPRKPFGMGALAGAGAGGMLGADLAAGSTPSNLGKIGDAALADADPLGVNVNVTFDEVGGLDEHIHSLKEMTLLPLLYPEVFQRFNVTPPRGVLFHGPPGTGKTLLARALAASCRSNGKSISFFMRKGADCLSKWVGEAERQLRLLFEEARASQPSIIFFDEIDGLAPVRSSKQDQIHASIVSTLLALMDGMDGRGQVVVIGATNRPDAVDPALRRPGRFDREFYFGLPGLEAREKILGIMTKGWEGWGGGEGESDEGKKEETKERVRGLAKLTKGYGGADLRALCTEAALNAVQRKYPQIYRSNDRLLVKPEDIGVGLRDFMISIKKLVPSSARSTSSAATPLPPQFEPLLKDTLEKVKEVIGKVMPVEKKLTALEEAEFEDDGGEEGALEREMLMQSMEKLRVYRPRVILHGPVGMGQGYVGAAALHHLEGYHVQSLELGTLMSDSTRSVEAAIVQLFVEAKRHQPSVIYIPSLVGWCAAVTETSRSTVRAMLDTLAPTDPILLLAIVDGHFAELPRDVKAWFGPSKDNRVELKNPSVQQREEYFDGLIKDIRRPPNQFVDGVKRRKRILEELPIAPPLEPRKPTPAELALQEENDQRVITLLKYRLGPILTELKRKFKRFTKRATDEYNFDEEHDFPPPHVETVTTTLEVQSGPNVVVGVLEEETVTSQPVVNGQLNGTVHEQEQQQQPVAIAPPPPPLFDMDLEKMHTELYKGRYLTPQEFLDDVGKIVHNAGVRSHEDLDRLYKAQAMFTAAQVSIQEFDPQLRTECERMAVRERQRRDEYRKSRGRGKTQDGENGNVNGIAPGARRSARTNGQQPELPITDPVKLERRLKRQRDDGATDSHGSEEDSTSNNGDEGRDAKRSKMDAAGEDDRDPLNLTGPMPLQPRSLGVRFAPIEPMQPLEEAKTDTQDQMVVDELPRRTGFDSFLLNPMSPSDNLFAMAMNGPPAPPPVASADPSDPFTSQPSTTIAQTLPKAKTPTPPLPTPPPPSPGHSKAPSPAPMVIERSPTPPLPDFHLDEDLVSDLKASLRDDTDFLTIEQLEQLRATCLGNVWRHRSDWDRDGLVRELHGVIKEFIQEVSADSADWDSPSSS